MFFPISPSPFLPFSNRQLARLHLYRFSFSLTVFLFGTTLRHVTFLLIPILLINTVSFLTTISHYYCQFFDFNIL